MFSNGKYKNFAGCAVVGAGNIVNSSDMTIDATGNDVFIKDNLKLNDIADATADTAAHGQIWVHDTTPNELCFTDDAGTDIIGIGKYHYECKFVGFNASSTGIYLPYLSIISSSKKVSKVGFFIKKKSL